MGLLDQIGSYVGSHDKGRQLKVSELRPIEAGKTVPPVSPRAKVVHLRSFETIADDLEAIRDKISKTHHDNIELENAIRDAREKIQQEMRDLKLKENTLQDELSQHIEAILPGAELIHHKPAPPHPDELDVTVQTPPAIPETEQ